MNFLDLLTMSVNNLWRRKLRTFLTVLGVIIGTASIVVMISLGMGMNKANMEQIEKYGGLTTINVYAKKGTIGEIRGFEELKALPSCYFMLQNAPVGTVCNEDKAILTKVGMAYFCSEHADELAADVQQMNQIVQVLDVDGNDMV